MINHSQLSTLLRNLLVTTTFILISGTQLMMAQSLKGRIVAHVAQEDMKIFEVEDVSGHTLGLLQARGLAFLDNGEVAEVMATEIIDNTNGKGTYQGYEVLTFEDGSTVVSQFEGQDSISEDGKYVLFEGAFNYIHGTGRFAGIEGGGTHEGRNHISSGVGFYVNFEGTYSLSSN